ncbi:MAG TPA: cobalamin biosynthesis protein [Xanthobacteraceae bacterium]|nr:cobalamin biosynthesis protein [Xanthobacteraceae bacterium]
MIVAGIGCRRGVGAEAIEAAIAAALTKAGTPSRRVDALATAIFKSNEEGIAAVAAARGIPLILVEQADMARASNQATHSRRVMQLMGVGSVAEVAALAAGGAGARLLVPRLIVGSVVCALAIADGDGGSS